MLGNIFAFVRRRQQVAARARLMTGQRGKGGRSPRSGMALRGHHDPDQVGGIPGAELFHDVGAMILDGARADPKVASGLLVGSAGGELLQHFALAPRQWFLPWKMQGSDV